MFVREKHINGYTVARHDPSKIRRLEVVGSFWSARVDLRRYLADAIPVRIKGFQKVAVLRGGGGLQPEERILGDEERHLLGAVVAPETNRVSGRIVAAAWVREM